MNKSISKRRPWIFLALAALVLMITSCAQAVDYEILIETEPYGFWNGLWHGIIAPISFIISLFKEEVVMYAVNNNGAWYNLGFLMGASMTLGGSCKASCKKS